MVELLKAVILGAVQGLTEFLPVSSSGHLVIFSELLHFQEQGVVFDVFLHLGTLMAVLLAFRSDILSMVKAPFAYFGGRRDDSVMHFLLWDVYVILATLPAVVVGLFFKDAIESLFNDSLVSYIMLIVTGLLMVATRKLPQRDEKISAWRSVVIGCGQACAIVPGLSRSGTTIFVGMALGIAREKVAKFSFIMSIPAILGAAVLQSTELLAHPPTAGGAVNLAAGTVTSLIAGYLAIKLLLDVVRKNRLPWFGYYCLSIAAIGLSFRFLG